MKSLHRPHPQRIDVSVATVPCVSLMSTTAADRRKPNSQPFVVAGREVMDVDLDDDPSLWPFDPLAFISNPSSPLILSSSPAPMPSFAFASPPSPLWLFEDRAASAEAAFGSVAASADFTRFITRSGVDSNTRQLQLTVEEGSVEDSCMIKERMTLALRNLKEATDQHLLVQVWAPVKNGNRYVLTTSGQPFVLDPHSNGLLQYRTVSVTYVFSVDGENDSELGLPGRVFRQKVPEWTPNVQYYSSKEYPRLTHALNYNVQGTLALPVFEPSGQSCVGVVELIMTSQKINYAGEVDKVCKALEAVNLKSSKILDHPTFQICNEGRQAVFAEILQTLTMVCEEHHLPLAQTWVPCRYRSVLTQGGGSRKSCSSFDGSCMGQVCMSTTDVAFHVIDGHMWGFREACVEHHLQKGQGVAGRSFASRRPFFCKDITQFCKTEYPLVHYARMFKLLGSFAICLQSNLTGSDDYILEFFLPPDCKDLVEQRTLLKLMISSMAKCFRSLKIVTSVEPQEENCLEDIDMFSIENEEMEPRNIYVWKYDSQFSKTSDNRNHEVDNDTENLVATSLLADQMTLMDANCEKNNKIVDLSGHASCSSLIDKSNKPPERKRGKAEKKISLEVLQQYFTGSLKDAAKSLGVCPTTMKRICRQHGISRWPSRKINKVNRSLSKLKRVIESVQGTDAAFNLTSFTGPLPTVAPISWPVNLDEFDVNSAKTSNLAAQNYQEKLAQISPNTCDGSDALKEFIQGQNDKQAEPGKDSNSSKSRSSSGQGSTNAHTSEEDSCQGSPNNETPIPNQHEDDVSDPRGPSKLSQGPNPFMLSSLPLSVFVEPQLESGRVIADSGSSKDLNVLCKDLSAPLGIGFQDERNVSPMINPTDANQIQDLGMVTIKAMYKEDIIRFRLPFGAGIMVLKNEVAKRLKLDVGTFDIRYLDDDQEWVILTCNSDLEECMEISKRYGKHLIRLLVSDTLFCPGSSCESTGGL